MKTRLLAFAFSFALSTGFSQITIGTNDMPSPGDTVRLSVATNTGTVDYTLSGPSALWDFSTLIPNYQDLVHLSAPTALPFNFLSTIAVLNPTPDSLPLIGAVPSDFTDYFKNGSSSYRQNGISFTYSALTSFAIPVIFTANDYVYRFPMNYGNLDTSDAAYNFSIPNLAYIGQKKHRTNAVDGWGTLITPYGTFNTLRVVSVIDATDTISIDTLGQGFSIPRPTLIEYKWLATGMDLPVLEVDVNVIASAPIITAVKYQDSLRVNLPQVGISENVQNVSFVDVFPNPTQQNCTVAYNLKNSSMVKMVLCDLSGRTVFQVDNGMELAGMHTQNLEMGNISPGVYFMRIESGATSISRKIIVTH